MRGKKLLSLLLSTTLIGTMLPTAALATVDSGADSSPLVCTTDEGGAAENHEENTLVSTPAILRAIKPPPAGRTTMTAIPSGFRKPLTLL